MTYPSKDYYNAPEETKIKLKWACWLIALEGAVIAALLFG